MGSPATSPIRSPPLPQRLRFSSAASPSPELAPGRPLRSAGGNNSPALPPERILPLSVAASSLSLPSAFAARRDELLEEHVPALRVKSFPLLPRVHQREFREPSGSREQRRRHSLRTSRRRRAAFGEIALRQGGVLLHPLTVELRQPRPRRPVPQSPQRELSFQNDPATVQVVRHVPVQRRAQPLAGIPLPSRDLFQRAVDLFPFRLQDFDEEIGFAPEVGVECAPRKPRFAGDPLRRRGVEPAPDESPLRRPDQPFARRFLALPAGHPLFHIH